MFIVYIYNVHTCFFKKYLKKFGLLNTAEEIMWKKIFL